MKIKIGSIDVWNAIFAFVSLVSIVIVLIFSIIYNISNWDWFYYAAWNVSYVFGGGVAGLLVIAILNAVLKR